MKRIGLTLMAILLLAFPLFSQNGNLAEDSDIHFMNSYDQAFLFETFSAQDSILLDSVFYYYWDEFINDWNYIGFGEEHGKTIYTYDENGNLILEIPHHWNSETNEWSECSVRRYTYDENGNRILETHYILDEILNERVETGRIEYTYDENGNQTISAHFWWNETTLDWFGYEKLEYGYDENGRITFRIEYHWDNRTKDWIEYRKQEYVYDGNNKIVLVTKYSREHTHWREDGKDKSEYTYDEKGNILSEDLYYWGSDTKEWIVGERKYEYAYDENGNMILEIGYSWNHSTNEFQENEKNEYAFDDGGNKTQEVSYNDGHIERKLEYTYDENENLIVEITFYVDDTTNDWMLAEKVEWYYSNHNHSTQIRKNLQTASLLRIYPNPAYNLLTIETEYSNYYSIDIISLNGQYIFTGEMEGTSHQLDLSSFQKGVYFITIRSNDFVTTRKIIKL